MGKHLPPRVSLCMIVKNEARLLADCLKSARPIADQLIVVDTGSTDQSPAIAKAHGAEVYHHPWEGDFSKARNQSLSYATGDWIFILDGDELIDGESLDHFRALDLGPNAPEAYRFQVLNFTTDRALPEEAGLISQVRLFKNKPQHKYGGIVHNQLQDQDTGQQLLGPDVPVRILHYGYTPTVWAAQNKDDRLSLHESAVQSNPDSPFLRYNYGNHLKILGRHAEALEQLIMAIPPIEVTGVVHTFDQEKSLPPELEWGLNACFLGAFCANQIGAYEIALSLTEEALHRSPSLIDARVRRGEALIELQRLPEAITCLQEGLLHPSPHVVKRRALYFDAPYRLGRAHFLSKQFFESAAAFASILPRCEDVTVMTHLCLCATHMRLRPLWEYFRSRGHDLAPDDPDWRTVDHVEARNPPAQPWPLLPISVECPPDSGWRSHLQLGLEKLGSADILESTSRELTFRFILSGEGWGRVEAWYHDDRLYRFPERYAPLELATPEESASILLCQLFVLSAA